MFNEKHILSFTSCPIIAVLVVDELEQVSPLFETLLEAGITNFELTLRTKKALTCLKAATDLYPNSNIGAGTVIAPHQIDQVIDAGAKFAVAPGCYEPVLDKAKSKNFPFAPGVSNPSDIERALAYETNVLKYFPAEAGGGLKYLNAMIGPYQHLNLKFIPLGGLNLNNVQPYLEHPDICAVGGSWIATKKDIQNKHWSVISNKAQLTLKLAGELKG
jgi:2-dehydro-3-deoxyphosphogluconate aldolase/(4S)-4-hydroxy-2-oxoglutarate aldolase